MKATPLLYLMIPPFLAFSATEDRARIEPVAKPPSRVLVPEPPPGVQLPPKEIQAEGPAIVEPVDRAGAPARPP